MEFQYFDTPIDLYKVDPVGSAEAEFPHRNKQVCGGKYFSFLHHSLLPSLYLHQGGGGGM